MITSMLRSAAYKAWSKLVIIAGNNVFSRRSRAGSRASNAVLAI
jgi:hypothetical protein